MGGSAAPCEAGLPGIKPVPRTANHVDEITMNLLPLAICYVFLALCSAIGLVVVFGRRSPGRRRVSDVIDLAVLGSYTVLGLVGALSTALGHPPGLPFAVKAALNRLLTPASVMTLWLLAMTILLWRPNILASPWAFWHVATWASLWFLLSLADIHFAALVLKPDHMAVVFLVAFTGFFTWLGLRQSVLNDLRIERGRRPREATKPEQTRVFVWPDLVYIELIAMLGMTCVLGIWSLAVRAPLEAPADPAWTPNPAKAPWYFVGLQELLVYFEPWFAGVIVPIGITVGLCLIPYLRRQDQQSGYYWLKGRRFSVATFLFGLGLWVLLILIGTFFRGPDWRLYGLYESRMVRRFDELHTVPLSHLIWGFVSRSTDTSLEMTHIPGSPFLRELPGLVMIGLLFFVFPYWAKHTFGREWAERLGKSGYWTVAILLAMMALIPIKMYANWLFDINYFIYLPEIGLSL